MKYIVSITLLSFVALTFDFLNAAAAHTEQPASDDKAAIRVAITDYIQGYYLSDPIRMERSLHPHYLKHTISGSNGNLQITEKTGPEMVEEVRTKDELTPESDRKKEISILDLNCDVASVKLVAAYWTNYMTLCKQNGQWKILSVVKRNQD